GWKLTRRLPITQSFEAPEPDLDLVKEVAADAKRYAVAINPTGPPVSANCFAIHRPEMAPGTAESVLSGTGLSTFYLDLQRVPADSPLGRWLSEPHIFGGSPARLAHACSSIVFVEAGAAQR